MSSSYKHLYDRAAAWDDQGFFKTSEFAATDKAGNPSVHKIHLTKGSIIKCAAPFPSEVRNVLGSLEEDPGGVWTVCNALGSAEVYGCFPAGTPVLMADGSTKAIDRIEIGDQVWTHEGRRRGVEKLWRRHNGGGLVRPRIVGALPGPWMTPNHPVFVVTRDDSMRLKRKIVYKRKYQEGREDLSLDETQQELCGALHEAQDTLAAEHLHPGDVVAMPFEIRTEITEELNTVALARLLGYYLADGCPVDRKDRKSAYKSIVMVHGDAKPDVHAEVIALAAARGHQVTPRPSSHGASTRLEVCDAALADICVRHLSRGAKKKRLSPQIKRMSREWQLAFLGAYLNCDGHQQDASRGRYAGTIRASTASRCLAKDLQELCWRLGIRASVNGRVQTGGYGPPSWIYEVVLGSTQVAELLPYTRFQVEPRDEESSSPILLDQGRGFAYLPVRAVCTKKWEGDVFNIQVEQDHSYVANRLVVGNSNSNGDLFPKLGLSHMGEHYGHKTFEKNAFPYTHHCFPSGTQVVLEDGTRVPVEEVLVGQSLRSHRANPRLVEKVWVNGFSGNLVSLNIQGLDRTIELTPNHPVYSISKEQVQCIKLGKSTRNRCTPENVGRAHQCTKHACPRTTVDYTPEFVCADKVCVGDFVLTPIGRPAEDRPISEKERATARIMGYFLAEGCYGGRREDGSPRSLQFTFNADGSDTSIINDLIACLKVNGLKATGPYPHRENNTLLVEVGNAAYAAETVELLGDLRARDKRVPLQRLREAGWSRQMLLNVLGAYLDGDGHQYVSGPNNGQVRGRSVSRQLLLDMKDLALHVGIPCSVQWDGKVLDLPARRYVRKDGTVVVYKGYKTSESGVLSFNQTRAGELSEYSFKLKAEHSPRGFSAGPFIWNGYLVSPVRKVQAVPYEGPVYNFKMAEDETYVAGEIAVHNCNKDPLKSIGDRVKFAHWDEPMEKVLLIYKIGRAKAPDIAERLDRGEPVPVSMGCFVPGTPVKLFDGRTRPIEDIKVGDRVINSAGKIVAVTEVHPRQYKGRLYAVKTATEDPTWVTSEHPYLILRREDVKQGRTQGHKGLTRFRPDAEIDIHKAEWVHASCLRAGDFAVNPVNLDVVTPDYVTDAAARLLGYYLAEGHLLRNKQKEVVGIELTTGVDDAIHDEIEQLCSDFGTKCPPVTTPRRNSAKARKIDIFDRKLAEFCEEHAGSYAKGKYLSASAMLWDQHYQLHVLGAFTNGDGCQVEGKRQLGTIAISTANLQLANQLVFLAARCGILANINYVHHKPSEKSVVKIETFEAQVYIGRNYVNALIGYARIQRLESVTRSGNRRKLLPLGFVLSPIMSVEQSPVTYVGMVHNFEVSEGESYVVNGAAVHNCKVPYDICSKCGNKATKVANYCSDLKYYMGATQPDGSKIAAINVFPNFFDISHVLRGADKIAFALGKVSPGDFAKAANARTVHVVPSAWRAEADPFRLDIMKKAEASARNFSTGKKASVKAADIEKEIPGTMEKLPEADPEEAAIGQALPYLEAREPQLPRDLLNAMGESPLGSVLDTVGGLGMVLQPAEFQRVLLAQSGQIPLADQLEHHAADFSQLPTPIFFKQAAFDPHPGEEADHPRKGKALDYWDGGPDLISAILPMISPDDFGPNNLTGGKTLNVSNKIEDGGSWLSSKHADDIRFDHDLADVLAKYAWERSGYSKALYGRMLDALAPHTKVAGDGLSDQAQGPTRIIVISGGGHSGSGMPSIGKQPEESKSDGLSGMGGMLAGILPTMLALKVLYELYRGKTSSMHTQGGAKRAALREPLIGKLGFVSPGNSSSTYNIKVEADNRSEPERFRDEFSEKRSGLTGLLASKSAGLPTRAFFKYAYRSGPQGRNPAGIKKNADLLCSDFFLSAYLADPLHNREKRATVMAVADNNLIDAATIAGLTYVQRVLGGN